MLPGHLIEPILPADAEQVLLTEIAADLRVAVAGLLPKIGASSRAEMAHLLRAMNSYYSNKIEGQHTFPAELEQALEHRFSLSTEVRRRQELAVAHMKVEEELEAQGRTMGWGGHFSSDWIRGIHRRLYGRLDETSRILLDHSGQPRGMMTPGEFRDYGVMVGHHNAPEHTLLPDLLRHFEFRYSRAQTETSRLLMAASSLHRLSWIHPFPDGNGRVSRLHNHLLLSHMGLTEGLWSPLRGLARRQGDYYGMLAEADAERRGDWECRGHLSSSGLAAFIRFWLEVCIDHVQFMRGLLALEGLKHRFIGLALQILHDYGRGALLHHRSKLQPELLGNALYRLFTEDGLERGEFKAMLATSDRTASRVVSILISQRLVSAPSRVGRLHSALPFYSLKYLFPGLWPEAEGTMIPPSRTDT